MQYGICHLSIIPCRSEPSHRAEQCTQILFGEHYSVLETLPEWVKIRNAFDSYESWISAKQFFPISEELFLLLQNIRFPLVSDLLDVMHETGSGSFPVVMGSPLPNFTQGRLNIDEKEFVFEGNCSIPDLIPIREKLVETAFMFLRAPYLWGGRSPLGTDCSGFCQQCYRINGINLPRDAKDQALLGRPLSFLEESQPGDLAFFDNEEGKITHVGIILSNQKIIHASGEVKINQLDHEGIFDANLKKYTHHLRVIRNYF